MECANGSSIRETDLWNRRHWDFRTRYFELLVQPVGCSKVALRISVIPYTQFGVFEHEVSEAA
jgi:hypothetical protein